jgi:hypothetical protein
MKAVAVPAILLLAGLSVAFAGDKAKSGLPVGEKVPAFNVRDITGPNKGKTLCYRCKYGASPTVAIFARDVDDNLTEVIAQIDKQVAKNENQKMAAFVVFLTDDADKLEPKLEELAKTAKITKTPLTVMEGEVGPPDYKIAKDADITVMMWVEGEVKANHSFAKGELKKEHAEKIASETKKILE